MNSVNSCIGASDVPSHVRRHSTLADPDYIDCYTIQLPAAATRDAERWARAILEDAPLSRHNARRLWRLLGLRLGPPHVDSHIQGWKIADRACDWVSLVTSSWYLSANAVCLVDAHTVSISVSLRNDRPPAALVWALVSHAHQRAVPTMLRQAAELIGR